MSSESNPSKSLLEQVTISKLVLINAGIALIAFNLSNVFNIAWYITFVIGILAQCLFYLYAKNKQQKIKVEIEKRLPEILEIMSRVYRVHSDLRVTLSEVAIKMHEPIIKEKFNQMVRLSRFGYTVEESMEQIAKEIQSNDFDFVVTSIKLNVPVGGDLPHLFEHTAKLLRQRKEAKTEIDNLMFQSKISSIISALLVPAIILVAFTSSQKYQEVLLHNPTGRLVFFGCLFWWILGVIMIRKNSRIRI
jgi:tight adherence protein B